MSDLTFYIILTSVVGALAFWELLLVRRQRQRHAAPLSATIGDDILAQGSDPGFLCPGSDLNLPEEAKRTLGNEQYHAMNLRLSKLLSQHMFDDYVTVSLNGQPANDDCSDILHHLLPGDTVVLLKKTMAECPVYLIFAKGRQVGVVSGEDYERINSIMTDSELRGAYVWRQSSFGSATETDVDLVLFSRQRKGARGAFSSLMHPDRLQIKCGQSFTLFQN